MTKANLEQKKSSMIRAQSQGISSKTHRHFKNLTTTLVHTLLDREGSRVVTPKGLLEPVEEVHVHVYQFWISHHN